MTSLACRYTKSLVRPFLITVFFLSRSFFLNGSTLVTNSSPSRFTPTVNRTPVEKECSSLAFVYCHYILIAKHFFPSANALVFPELFLRMVLSISVSYFHTFPFTHMLCVVLWVLLEGKAPKVAGHWQWVNLHWRPVSEVCWGKGPQRCPTNHAQQQRFNQILPGTFPGEEPVVIGSSSPMPSQWVSGHRPFCERTAWGRQSEPTTP